MNHFKIKVCGITRPEDASLVAELGGDMIGLIFYRRSPRAVTIAQARAVVAAIPPTVSRVGVFVGDSVALILRRAEQLNLDYAQLHGEYRATDVTKLKVAGLRVIQVFQIVSASDYRSVTSSRADLILLDNAAPGLQGGTGEAFDWTLKPPRSIKNLVLAGGINAGNVEQGVRTFNPLVVDVNSGVESQPGVKSSRKLRQFFTECNRIRYGR